MKAGGRMKADARAALGFRSHSGWAALVVVAGASGTPGGGVPDVIERRRVQTADSCISGSLQPYHAAKEMQLAEAEAFLDRCGAAIRRMAETAVREAVAELAAKGYNVAGACVLLGSGRPATGLAATLRSHPMIHTAEGDFFRGALKAACESCGLPVLGVKEKDLLRQAAAALGVTADHLQLRVADLGKRLGPPWRQDEKLCAIAGWLALRELR
jgi:hypothetical protein